MKLIDADVAIEKLTDRTNQAAKRVGIDSPFWEGLVIARRIVNNLPTVQPEPQWIPCSERLPEEDHWLGGSGKQFSDNVLVSLYNSDDEDEWVDVSQTIDGEWGIELPRHCKIVAWMPLPEPYQSGAERRTDE